MFLFVCDIHKLPLQHMTVSMVCLCVRVSSDLVRMDVQFYFVCTESVSCLVSNTTTMCCIIRFFFYVCLYAHNCMFVYDIKNIFVVIIIMTLFAILWREKCLLFYECICSARIVMCSLDSHCKKPYVSQYRTDLYS